MPIPHQDELVELLNMSAPVTDAMIHALEDYVELQSFPKGEEVIVEGKRCFKVFAVRTGIFRNYVDDNGADRIRWFGVRGDVFTAMVSLSAGLPAVTSVQCLTPAECWTISIENARKLLADNSDWRDWMLKMLTDGFSIREQRDAIMVSTDAYKRFKRFYNIRNLEIINSIPLKHIASYLRVTPQTLSSCRRRFVRENDSDALNMLLKFPGK